MLIDRFEYPNNRWGWLVWDLNFPDEKAGSPTDVMLDYTQRQYDNVAANLRMEIEAKVNSLNYYLTDDLL